MTIVHAFNVKRNLSSTKVLTASFEVSNMWMAKIVTVLVNTAYCWVKCCLKAEILPINISSPRSPMKGRSQCKLRFMAPKRVEHLQRDWSHLVDMVEFLLQLENKQEIILNNVFPQEQLNHNLIIKKTIYVEMKNWTFHKFRNEKQPTNNAK